MVQQPWLVQYQQSQFQQVYRGPEQQGVLGNGQPHFQKGYQQPYYNGCAHQSYKSHHHHIHCAGIQRPTAQVIHLILGMLRQNSINSFLL